MAGQLIQRGERTWLIRVYKDRDANGKRRYVNKTIHGNRKDAQRALNKLLHQKDTGALVEPSKQTLNAYLERWLDVAAKPRLRESTYTDHQYRINRYILPTLGATRLARLTALDIQALYTHIMAPASEGGMGLTPRSVRIVHNILNPALKQAVRWKLIPHNPAADVDLPSETKKEMKALSPEEAARFLDAARCFPGDPDVVREKGHDPRAGRRDRFFAFWCVMLAGGLRPSEALALRWDDLDGDRLRVRRSLTLQKGGGWTLTEPKTAKSRRTVPLPGFAVEALRNHRREQAAERLEIGKYWNDHGFIFAAENGEPLNSRNLDQRHFKRILKAAGLPPLRMYDLRHSHATLLLANGEHPKVVSERMGHASVTLTLDTYSHVLPGMQEQATERLDALLTAARKVRPA